MWLDRDDETFKAILFLPWINSIDQNTLFVTMTYLMPKARMAIRHFFTHVNVDNERTRVKGFRIRISEGPSELAMNAIMLSETVLL